MSFGNINNVDRYCAINNKSVTNFLSPRGLPNDGIIGKTGQNVIYCVSIRLPNKVHLTTMFFRVTSANNNVNNTHNCLYGGGIYFNLPNIFLSSFKFVGTRQRRD